MEASNGLLFTSVNETHSFPVTLAGKAPYLNEDQSLLMNSLANNHDNLLIARNERLDYE